ncbi:MAG: adenylyltransferase/cytidyltransferase family protein [Phycisphaerales bacterium]|nr:adenylyltransferase/cytidyltransferase family protein [Phycisphaerales bacterium]
MESAAKILSREQLLRVREQARRDGRRVVQCHGCFDIVHPGHIRHLRFARQLGDILLVTLTGDSSIAKGTGRPLIPEELRADNLAALDFVDWVHVESRPTAGELLGEVRPDVYVKGREYEFNSDPRFKAERRAVEDHGGRVVFSSGDVVFSSTALIAALEQSVDPFHARLRDLLARDEAQGATLGGIVSAMRGVPVVVVGETILDTYVLCDRPDVAGESPIMTLRPAEYRHYDGGAAIIARHAAALGARPVLITPMPTGGPGLEAARAVRQRLIAEGVDVRPIPVETPLPEKQRFLVGAQKVMKVDLVDRLVVDTTTGERLVQMATAAAREVHAGVAIVADFGLGLFSSALLRRLCLALREHAAIMAGDVSGRRSNLTAMSGMDLLCPSEGEVRDAMGLHDQGLPAVTWRLLERTNAKRAIISMGGDGLIAFDRIQGGAESEPASRAEATTSARSDAKSGDGWARRLAAEHIPALCPFAVDPLGCGDSLLTTAALALGAGGSLLSAAILGAAAAGVQAQRLGNLPVSATDVRHGVARLHASHLAYAPAEVLDAHLTPRRELATGAAS